MSSAVRKLAALAALIPAALLVSWNAGAQAYPAKPIRLVVPFAAGGAQDTFARIVGQGLGSRMGQSVVVENRPSAAGIRDARISAD
ncbi:MAG: hypothetical protein EXR27_14000 [Betaproteobacteria bacterium]|nr:hypothetical protein [Betaproteobacteria bacterium]